MCCAGCSASCGFHSTHKHPHSAVTQNQAVEKGLLKYFLWVKNICWSVNLSAVCVTPAFLHSWWCPGDGCYWHDLAWAVDACPLRTYNGNSPRFEETRLCLAFSPYVEFLSVFSRRPLGPHAASRLEDWSHRS